MDRVNQNPKQRVPVAPQNVDIITAKIQKKKKKKKKKVFVVRKLCFFQIDAPSLIPEYLFWTDQNPGTKGRPGGCRD